MPAYRLRTAGGATRPVAAGRVVVVDGEVRFQSPGTGGWVTVDSVPVVEVARLDRRFNEADGRVRWVPEDAVEQAARAARPQAEVVPPPPRAAVAAEPAGQPAGGRPAASRAEPAAVSARDVRCPRCGEDDDLSGRRVGGDILLTCHACGYEGPRSARRTCPTCGGDDVLERPKAVVERSRGTQLSIVGWTTVHLCRGCDADTLAAALAHGGAVMPAELPTVDPQTLRDLGRGAPG